MTLRTRWAVAAAAVLGYAALEALTWHGGPWFAGSLAVGVAGAEAARRIGLDVWTPSSWRIPAFVWWTVGIGAAVAITGVAVAFMGDVLGHLANQLLFVTRHGPPTR